MFIILQQVSLQLRVGVRICNRKFLSEFPVSKTSFAASFPATPETLDRSLHKSATAS